MLTVLSIHNNARGANNAVAKIILSKRIFQDPKNTAALFSQHEDDMPCDKRSGSTSPHN